MTHPSPVILQIDRDISNTLAETYQKLDDLRGTATRMDTIIKETTVPKVRISARTPKWVRYATIAVFSAVVLINAGLGYAIYELNTEYQQHIATSMAQQQVMLEQIRCLVERERTANPSYCLRITETR